MTNNYIKQLFLKQYFRIGAALGAFFDGKRVFDCLSDVYMIDADEAGKLFELVNGDGVREIDSTVTYHRFLRLLQYARENAAGLPVTAAEAEVINLKGQVIREAEEAKLVAAKDAAETTVYDMLESAAGCGNINAMCILGALLCAGIFVSASAERGLTYLRRASRWNSLDGALFALRFDEACRDEHCDLLYSIAGGPYADAVGLARAKYGIKRASQFVPESDLLESAIGLGKYKADTYVPTGARLIYGRLLSKADRRKILMSDNRELINEADDLPLKLAYREIEFFEDALSALPVKRDGEQAKIIQGAYNGDLRTAREYKPMCLCSESEFVLGMYAGALMRMFDGANVKRIDVAEITEDDLAPTKNNIFLRLCNEDNDNVYLLVFHGHIREYFMAAATNFLVSERRRNMRLSVPGVSVDLGAILPVCLCDKANARELKKFCDIIELANVTAAERPNVIDSLLVQKAKAYAVKSVKLDEGAKSELISCETDVAERALDRAIRDRRRRGKSVSLTRDIIREYTGTGGAASNGKFGFR